MNLDSLISASELFSTPNADTNNKKLKQHIDSVFSTIRKIDPTVSLSNTRDTLSSIVDSMNKITAFIKRVYYFTNVSEFDYIDDHGVNRHAKCSTYHVPSEFHSKSVTDDPKWYILNKNDNSWNGPFEYLNYLGAGGGIWKTKIHAEYHKHTNTCKLWIETERPGGGDTNGLFEIIDWNGARWDLRLPVSEPGPVNIPQFKMTPLRH
jgi:hypothetical protein